MREKIIDIREIRELAKKFSPEEMEECIELHLKKEKHECPLTGTDDHIINELAKAEFVRKLVDKGALPLDAVRQLAERIRRFQESEKN
ncbi:MAG: hypothetical protein M0Z61_04635 [Nitrospiraceae bacterium]|nr:hypothetical protein [Nitrospiraceae bacterium]